MYSLHRLAIRMASLAFTLCAVSAFGQNQSIGPNGEGSFIAGPQGVPRMVLNEADSWSQPLVVFRNPELELIIPDIRTTGWAASYADAFKREGTYLTYLYLYGVKTHRTIRDVLYVNTHTKIAVIVRNAVTPPMRVDLCKPDPSMPIDKVTAIVEQVSDSYHGQSLDDSIAEQKYAVARQMACNDPNSADCKMSEEEFRQKHPIYSRARTPTDTLMAQIGPITARRPDEPCQTH